MGKTVRRDAQSAIPSWPFLDEKALRALFRTALDASGLEAALPPESAAMLSVTGPERLGMFLRAQPEQTEVLSLEEEYDAEIRVGGRIRRLTGNLDRVDWREQEDPGRRDRRRAVILDYKTAASRRCARTSGPTTPFGAAGSGKSRRSRFRARPRT